MGARKPVVGDQTNRGAGESLGSLQENAGKHTNWYDTINAWGGKGVETVDFSQRQFDENGRVKVTKYDVLLGRSQPELQAEYEKQRQAGVRNSAANQQFQRDNSGKGAVPKVGEQLYAPQTTNVGDIENLNTLEATRVTKVTPLLEELGRMDGGKLAIATKLGDKPTVSQVAAVIGELTPKQASSIRDQEAHNSNLETARSTRSVNEGNLALSRTQERNRNALALAEIDFKNNTNEYNWKTANADRDYKYRAAEADRELKKELALLGFEDKAADRRYDREERRDQNRQLLILQMMKGLQNLGSGFAL